MLKRMLMFTVLVAGFFAALGINGCQQMMVEIDDLPIVVRRELTTDPKTIDPHLAGDVVSSAQCGMVYEQLYDYDYLKQPAELVPRLAAALPTISEDGLSHRIKLREDVFFQDDKCFPGGKGRKMTADDVLFSIKRMAAHPETTGYWVVEHKIEGLDAYQSYAESLLGAIEDKELRAQKTKEVHSLDVPGLRKINPYEIEIRLTTPYQQLTYCMCMSYLAVMPREAVEFYGDEVYRNPVGTGPFVLKYWDWGRELVWERNPNYRKSEVFPGEQYFKDLVSKQGHVTVGETKINLDQYKPYWDKPLPLADRISFRILKESQASWLEFLAGHIDVFAPESDQFSVAIQNDSLSEEMKAKGIYLDKYERAVVEYFTFNWDDPKLGMLGGEKAKAIRKAFSCSLDREEYIRVYLNGRGDPAQMMVPRLFPEYDPNYVYPHSVHDPEKGRQILIDAGFELTKDGDNWIAIDPTTGEKAAITMLLRGTTQTSEDMATFLRTSCNKVGIEMTALKLEFPEFLKRQYGGTGQSYNAGWVLDYPDAQNMMMLVISKEARNNGLNSARYRNPEYDARYERVAKLRANVPEELAEKKKLIREMHDILADDCPWVLMYFQRTYRLNHKWSLQAIPNDFNYTLFKYAASDSKVRRDTAKAWRDTPILPAALMAGLVLALVVLFMAKVVRNQ